jgi:hypothetical protein
MKDFDKYFYDRFPASNPCSCDICINFCKRPGWWLVSEARSAISQGYAKRMMLELSPDHSFGVLSPAFKGNEGYFALQEYSNSYCTFLKNNRCTIFGKPFQPLECRFCHHDRIGSGKQCHYAIEKDWNTSKGKRLLKDWLIICDLHSSYSTLFTRVAST